MANALDKHKATVIAMEALEVLQKDIYMAALVQTKYSPTATRKGKTIQIPVIGALAANDKTTSAVTVQDATTTSVDVVMDKHKEATFLIHDVDQALADGDLGDIYIASAMTAISEAVDADLCGLYAGLSQTQGANGTPVTAAHLRTVRETLSNQKAYKRDRNIVASPELYSQLLGLSEFTDVSKYGSAQAVQEGELGKIYGFRVFESQNIVDATGNHNLVFQKNAFALATASLGVSNEGGVTQVEVNDPRSGLGLRLTASYSHDDLAHKFTVDVLYGVKEVRDGFAVDLIS